MIPAVRAALLSCFLLVLGAAAVSAGDIETVRARLVGAEILRADFRQQKSLPVLSRELTSRGGMILVRGRGILWHILEPFDRFVLVRPDQVTEWEDGAAAAKTTKATGAVMARVIKVILAAISGDIAYLEKYFAIAVEERPAGWHIALTPSATSGRGMFSRIEIEGDRFVETVVVTAAGGDVTTIRLDNFRTEPARLSEREMDYFDQ